MINVKKIMVYFFVACLVLLYSSVAFAAEDNQIHGSVKVSISFSKENAEQAKSWISNSLEKTKATIKEQMLIEMDSDKISAMKRTLEQQDLLSEKKLFIDNLEGSTSLVSGAPFVTVKIGNHTAVTDANSEFVLPGEIEDGHYSVTILYEDHELYSTSVHLEKNKRLDIVISQDEKGLTKAAEKMGRQMQPQEEASTEQKSTEDTQTIESALLIKAASSQILFPAYSVGSKVPWSINPGDMYIIRAGNLVGCNKADNASSDGGYESASFPLNNSDCAGAIALGIAYANNPIGLSAYYMNYNCYIEGWQNMDTGGTNVYCNGLEKSGYHFNCSWFYGIQHTETLHAHS